MPLSRLFIYHFICVWVFFAVCAVKNIYRGHRHRHQLRFSWDMGNCCLTSTNAVERTSAHLLRNKLWSLWWQTWPDSWHTIEVTGHVYAPHNGGKTTMSSNIHFINTRLVHKILRNTYYQYPTPPETWNLIFHPCNILYSDFTHHSVVLLKIEKMIEFLALQVLLHVYRYYTFTEAMHRNKTYYLFRFSFYHREPRSTETHMCHCLLLKKHTWSAWRHFYYYGGLTMRLARWDQNKIAISNIGFLSISKCAMSYLMQSPWY